MKIVTSDEMRGLEERCAGEGISTSQLMENAGLAVAEEVRRWRGGVAGSHIAVLVGPGNNGGDGLVMARHLHDWGANVYVYLCAPRPEADPNLRLILDREITPEQAQDDSELQGLRRILDTAEIVVDAVLGTGRSRPIGGVLKEVLTTVGKARADSPRLRIVALDLPSGLDADTGKVDPAVLGADVTVTLGYPKVGLFSFPGAQMLGELIVADIGLPARVAEGITLELMTLTWIRSLLPDRPYDAHKGTFGRALMVAGSVRYIGAAYLACQGAARVGAGLVTLACTPTLQSILASKLTEVTYLPLPELNPGIPAADAVSLIEDQLPHSQALLVGCGLGQEPPTSDLVQRLLLKSDKDSPPIVVDADGLNVLAQHPKWWERMGHRVVLTPHPGEMARLMDLSNKEVQSDRLGVARKAAQLWGKVVVLKGAHTVVARPDGWAKLSPFANP
ncbi:MAG: NAD(P)H-hydrate epimerase, partial [Dehalococcoidia bacterium]